MENYKEKYDKALEVIKKYRGAHILLTDDLVEEIFPELKEGSDEMVVKDMIETLQFEVKEFPSSTLASKASVWIPWLEKQLDKKSVWSDEDKSKIERLICYFKGKDNKEFTDWFTSLKNRVIPQENQVCTDEINPKFKVGDEIVDKDFPDNIFVVTEIINNGFAFVDKNGERFTKYYDDDNWDEYELVEKNVESKFKVGDWIVSDNGDVNQVTKINEYGDGYYLTDGTYFSGSWADMYRLWTIEDAKPGDILSCDDEVVIFKYNNYDPDTQNGCMFVYCSSKKSGNYWYVIGGINPTDFHPATKEEKEKLFKKMEEDGYAWNSDRLELSKTKDNTPGNVESMQKQCVEWTQEDEEMLEDVKNNFEYNKCEMTDGLVSQYDSFFDKIRKLKPQTKHKWSHNDEKQIREIINHLDASAKENPVRRRKYQSWIKWLKSLSPDSQWKPTEEQIATLMHVVNGTPVVKGSYIEGTLTELLNQLKEA